MIWGVDWSTKDVAIGVHGDCPTCEGAGELGEAKWTASCRAGPDPQTYESGPCPACHGAAVATHCDVALSRGDGVVRLLSLFRQTRDLALATLDVHGPPAAVYFETAFGDRQGQQFMHEASGAVKLGLWSVLQGRLEPDQFVLVSTTSWRSWAGLRPPGKDVGDKRAKRRWRKLQQREFAARFVDVTSLTEHECDAVGIAVAASMRAERQAAA